MTSPFVTAARRLLDRFQPRERPRMVQFTFDPHKPFGLLTGDLGEERLNLGAAGAMYVTGRAETFTDRDVYALFDLSCDRDEFLRWFDGLRHTYNGTKPNTDEQRALLSLDVQANRDLYTLMGLEPRINPDSSRVSK